MKGTISEAELFTLRCRLHEGRWNKARRGELTRSLPVGYIHGENGKVIKDADHQVQSRIRHIFRLFRRLRVARQVLLRLREDGLKIPTRVWGGPSHGKVVWKAPTFPAIMRILHNPAYAGVYVYGNFEYDSYDRSPKTGKARTRLRPVEDWPVAIQDSWPQFICWSEFLENQRVLRSNWYRAASRGAPRKGAALLQGIVFCGHRSPSGAWRRRQGPAGCGRRVGPRRARGPQQPRPDVTGCPTTRRPCSANASPR